MPRVVNKITDPLFASSWNLKLLNVAPAWKYSTGEGVVVAIIDSGVDGSHRDLGWSGVDIPLSTNNDEKYNDALYNPVTSAIATGKHPKIVPGWNCVDNNGITRDKWRHGTYLAGTVAAECDGFGMVGFAPDAKLMPIVVIDKYGKVSPERCAVGVRKAADRGADVINISIGWYSPSKILTAAIEHALDKGCIVLAATGNRGRSSMMHPAESSGALAIGGTDPVGCRWAMSDYGENLTAVAPGSSQHVTFWMRHRFTRVEGTSQACANMSGVAALVRSVDRGVGQASFMHLLKKYGSNGGVKLLETGYGYPDVGIMLEAIGHKPTMDEVIRGLMRLSRNAEEFGRESLILAKLLTEMEGI